MKKLTIALLIIFVLPSMSYASDLISADEINTLMKSKGKFFRLIGDNEYQLIDKLNIKYMLQKISPEIKRFSHSKSFDCEDKSLILHSEIRKYQLENNLETSLAFGEAIIERTKPHREKHAINFFISDNNKIYLIEPSTLEIYLLTRDIKLLFIKM